jgi:L-ascorbate metabolism protein UlaG (beta-lactamase superfamily)
MHISWHGHYTVKIQSDNAVIILDPHSAASGLTPLRLQAQIVALSSPSDPTMSYTEGLKGEPLLIEFPGEYSILGHTLHALGWHDEQGHEHSVQRWTIEDLVLLHLGALNRPLTDLELQELEKTDIDILLLPIGGGSGLTTKQALGLVTTFEPKVVIPIHYAIPGIKESLESVEHFAKEMGVNPGQREKKVIIKKKGLSDEHLQTFLLSP